MAKKSKSAKGRAPSDVEFEWLRGQIRTQRALVDGIAHMRERADPGMLYRQVGKLAVQPAYRSEVLPAPFPKTPGELPQRGFKDIIGFEHEFAWVAGLLRLQAGRLNDYLARRRRLETAMLSGELGEAERLLDESEADLGCSLWVIENRIIHTLWTGGAGAKDRYVHSVLSARRGLFEYLVSWASYRPDVSVSMTELDRLLSDLVPLVGGLPHLVHLANGRYPRLEPLMAAQVLNYTDTLPLIDRYELFLKALQSLAATGGLSNEREGLVRSILADLARAIDDARLRRLHVAFGGTRTDIHTPEAMLAKLDLYSRGAYAALLEEVGSARVAFGSIEVLNLAIRAALMSGHEWRLEETDGEHRPLLNQIASDLMAIADFRDEGIDARLRLNKLLLTFCNSDWAASLELVLARQANDERVFGPTPRQSIRALGAALDHPLLAFAMPGAGTLGRYAASLRQGHAHASPTLDMMTFVVEPCLPQQSFDLAPDRRHRLAALHAAREGGFAEAASQLDQLTEATAPRIAALEASVLAVRCHLETGDLAKAVDLAASLYLRSRYFGLVLPVRELVAGLLTRHNEAMASSATRGHLSTAIVYDIYSRYVASDHDAERADAYKDVLRRAGVRRASELPAFGKRWPVEELSYFLQYVCVPNVLDQSLELTDTRAVEDERLAILVALIELASEAGRTPPAALKDELREIRTRQVVRDTSLRLDESKIYVNVEGIRRAVDVEMRENWNRYRLMSMQQVEADPFEDLERILRTHLGDRDVTIIKMNQPLSERRKLFQRMIGELRDQFANSKEFGLNSNLSTNIRHGYVLRELRGPLVARNLITNKDTESGSYRENAHWLERLPEDEDELRAGLTDMLTSFSQKVDDIIEHLNRRLLRIRSDHNPEGLFDYSLSETALRSLEPQWSELPTYEEFLEAVFASLWLGTEANLKNVREVLHEKILRKLAAALDELDTGLRESGLSEDAPGLTAAITLAKSEVRSAVDRVASWFTLSGNHEYSDFDLEIAVNAGLQSVKAYYSNIDITHEYYPDPSSPVLQGWCLPIFARLFFLLLDNAAQHGVANRKQLEVSVSAEVGGGMLLLKIANDLPPEADAARLAEKILAINGEYGQARAMDLLGEEGGSGYAKVWKLLKTDLKRNHSLRVELREKRFVVEILMDTPGMVYVEKVAA